MCESTMFQIIKVVLTMYNKETVIRLNTLDDVQEFVGAASKCDFDIDRSAVKKI